MVELNPYWTNKNCVTAQDIRLVPDDLVCTEGVAKKSAGSLLVSTGLSGLSVQVAEGGAFIEGTQVDDQGMYHVFNDASVAVVVTTAHPTLPRVDMVIARVYDEQYLDPSSGFVLETVDGTPTSGANLTNLNGVGTLPDNSILLAYVLVPAGAVTPAALTFSDQRQPYRLCLDSVPLGVSLIAAVVITADGFFDKTLYPNGKLAKVTCIGGGGAGGGSPASTVGQSSYGTGGASGGTSVEWVDFDDITETGSGVVVDIGAGGLAAAGVDGADGTATSFGTYCKANGGSGGIASTDSASPGLGVGGPGAVATGAIGSIKQRGVSGGLGMRIAATTVLGGMGAPSSLGGGASAAQANGPGNDANPNSGAGGGGGVSENGEGQHFGGDGGSGICIVEVFG